MRPLTPPESWLGSSTKQSPSNYAIDICVLR